MERTWKTVKYEFIFLNEWFSIHQLEEGLETFINAFNSERPHEALGYQTPDEVYKKGCFPVQGIDITHVAWFFLFFKERVLTEVLAHMIDNEVAILMTIYKEPIKLLNQSIESILKKSF